MHEIQKAKTGSGYWLQHIKYNNVHYLRTKASINLKIAN
jgi:hypothetical protein